jgi:hypothetical protein
MIKKMKKQEGRKIAAYLSQTSARLLAGTQKVAKKRKVRR